MPQAMGFKLSKDPLFIEKVRDIVGPHLNPPDKALVLCVNEKAQIQALDRSRPLPPRATGPSRTPHPGREHRGSGLVLPFRLKSSNQPAREWVQQLVRGDKPRRLWCCRLPSNQRVVIAVRGKTIPIAF
jgi:hypothetical protein